MFQSHLVDGPLLLRMDENFALENLGINHALQRRKLMRAVEQLKKAQVRNFKVGILVRRISTVSPAQILRQRALCCVASN